MIRTKHKRKLRRGVTSKRLDPAGIVGAVCRMTGAPTWLEDLRSGVSEEGIPQAVAARDTARLYDWLVGGLSFQGVSNGVARDYIARHGNATYDDVNRALGTRRHHCPKLAGFEAYVGCGYRKGKATCANPKLLDRCPVPSHELRNGNLNQAAYSLFFFLRDICQGDLVGFIDRTLAEADCPGHPDRIARMRRALVGQLVRVHGLSHKVASMTLAALLIGGDPSRERWVEVGASLVAVDTLVHNFLHRTGILAQYQAGHRYGPACYGDDGCAGIIDRLAREIDCRSFGRSLPAYFPRFVQHCVWAFCAQDGLNVCNGNRIDDSKPCANGDCPVYPVCGRVALRPGSDKAPARAPAPALATPSRASR